ncbi:hypothetical protein CDAR_410771 [Caerostris darwini]|uniref:Uncharacterized protein n=1 Tax=Caerostris darwini TaxID=1538125 RepID=A0AAV4TAK9_9ARAC|nr:hypothetical protein CDAR_410771 [Caerostris darwini]
MEYYEVGLATTVNSQHFYTKEGFMGENVSACRDGNGSSPEGLDNEDKGRVNTRTYSNFSRFQFASEYICNRALCLCNMHKQLAEPATEIRSRSVLS